MNKQIISLGAFNIFIAIAAGAFAAHALKNSLSIEAITTVKTAAQYQLFHGLALILVAVLNQLNHNSCHKTCIRLILAGIVLFCGSLYLLALTSIKWLGFITPMGGLCFLLAWLILGFCYYPFKRKNNCEKH